MIQWYPGHMAKAKKILEEDLKLVDLVLEVLDARIPVSSRNPDLNDLLHKQKHIIILNKADLANHNLTKEWKDYFENETPVQNINSIKGKGIPELLKLIHDFSDKINKQIIQKGRKKRAIRIMIIGIPNVGKSALINALAGSSITRTGNKPGVTRGRQWINIDKKIKLLDTPGILWPKFEEEEVGYKLAITGAIADDIFDIELAAYKFIKYILKIRPEILEKTYDITITTDQPYDILPLISKKRGCLLSGGKIDRNRTSKILINDFRKGKLGSVTLETPDKSGDE